MHKQAFVPGLILFFLFRLPFALTAQTAPVFPNIQYITSDDGLSQSEVTCILQDRQGFLWIGTRGGLNRYDGYAFKVFQNEIGNTNSLINNSIESLFEDHKGNIWIGTKSNGLSCYNPELDRFEHFQHHSQDPNTISGNRIITIAESPNGKIWVGSWENGLSIIDPENKTFRRLLGSIKVNRVIPSQKGEMWAATSNGLYVFSADGQQLNRYQNPKESIQFVDVLEERWSGQFYLGTWGKGLFKFDPETGSFKQFQYRNDFPGSIPSNNAYHLFQYRQNRIWIGSWGGGLNLFHPDTETFTHYDLSRGNHNGGQELYQDVLCVFQDRSGILWVGTNGGGLCKIDERINQFGLMGKSVDQSALPNEPIWSIFKDSDGVLWIGSKGSEAVHYSLDGVPFSQLKLPKANSGGIQVTKNGARAFYQSKDGTIWLASNFSLYKIEKTQNTYQAVPVRTKIEGGGNPARLSHVSALYQSADGTFWIGRQQRGLLRSIGTGPIESRTYETYWQGKSEGRLKSNRISALLEDKVGRFWIGTYGGLHLYQPGKDNFLHFSKKQEDIQSLSSDIILCLHEDRQGNLWIGTPNGLNLAIPGINQSFTFQCFQEQDGLPNNYIHAILEDDYGHLWISTNKGISKYDREEQIFYNYDVADGLQSNTFMEGAAFRDSSGMLYFGGIYGLNFFHPDSIQHTDTAPPVVITGLKIFNQEIQAGQTFNDRIILPRSVEYSEKISLNYAENVFSIEFAALDFHAPFGHTYRYIMEGLEEEWNSAGRQRSVTYTHLKPGKYTFRVKVADNKGLWSESGASLDIQVLPPFWASWSAFVLYTLAFMGLLLLYRHFIGLHNSLKNKLEIARMEQQKEMEMAEMKTRFFTNITHELRTPLTLISGPVEEMMGKLHAGSRLKDHLMTIYHHTQRLRGLVNQLLDFRKAESGHMKLQVAEGNFVKFAREVYFSFRELSYQNDIDFSFEPSHTDIPLYFDRDKMEIVLCNLLSNAFKYTQAHNRITIYISQVDGREKGLPSALSNGYCEILVEDNGQGMPAELVEKIFDRFYQIVNTESVKLVGTGIGLSLVKNIVDLHKGQISVRSEVGEGSAFTIRLPMGRSHFSEEQIIPDFRNSEHQSHYQAKGMMKPSLPVTLSSNHQENGTRAGTLLILEDNPEIRAFIRNIFEENYRIIEAENGLRGLDLIRNRLPNLIISDVMMPEMDGLAFCKLVKEDEKTAHIPLILLTARTATVYQLEGYHSGADAYITKPFHPAILRAQVNSLLSGRQKLKEYFSKVITLQPTEIEINCKEEQFLNKVMKLVEDNLSNETLSRDFLAQSMAMSSSTFYRKIKTLTGYTVNAFIRSVRLKRAAQLMRNSKYNISEIAYQVGFNDLKYFRACFKKQFRTTPSQYSQNADKRKAQNRRIG